LEKLQSMGADAGSQNNRIRSSILLSAPSVARQPRIICTHSFYFSTACSKSQKCVATCMDPKGK
ncbi:MAG: hypothetical protein K6G04_02375, partial [Lachnospiraceae bacterium]|nr:hypothetical protein [Lachnospiraceae bacterium]